MKAKTRTQWISWLLCFAMLVTMLPTFTLPTNAVGVSASGTSGSASWTLEDGVFTISGGAMDNYASAEEQPWHDYADQIQKVVIGSGVLRLGDYAFADCTNLTEVEIGSTVDTIGAYAFENTTSLTEVKMPKNVKTFCDGMFHNSGLKRLYIYARKTEFEGFDYIYWEEDTVLPLDTVVYCYSFSHAYYHFFRDMVELTDDMVMNIDNGNSTVALDPNEYVFVRDLWAAADTADGLVLDYTVSMKTADILRVHNEMVEEYQKIGTDYHNNGKLFLEAYIQLQTDEGWIYLPTASAMYSIFEYNLVGDENNYHGHWGGSSSEVDFITITGDSNSVTVQINATMQELEAYAGMPVNQFSLYIGVEGESYRLSYGREVTNYEKTVESIGMSLCDARMRESGAEIYAQMTLDRKFTVEDFPWIEEAPGFYEPVSRHYVWNYTFARIRYGYDENDNWICIGDCFEQLEGDGIATEDHNGILYGGVRGTFDAGTNASVTIREMLSEEELAFVETLKGVDPMGYGGEARIELNYTLYLTFADGSTKVLSSMFADEISCIVGTCLHTCSVCGMCASEDLLACNSQYGWRNNECFCEDSSPFIESSCVEDAVVIPEKSYCYYDGVTARVETFDVELAVTTDYFKAIINSVGSSNVAAVYDITLYNEYGDAIKINEWGGTDEYITLTIPVSAEIAQAAANGELSLYHVSPDGIADSVAFMVDPVNNTITFTGTSFSPYVLLEAAPRYGMQALSKVDNATALLLAYSCIVNGVENAVDYIYLPSGDMSITLEEFQTVLDAYRMDYGEHFWLDNAYSYSGEDDGSAIYSFVPQYLFTGSALAQARAAFEEALEEMLSCVNDSMTEFEIAVALHDAVAAHVTYAEGENAHNAYGALINGICVCEGYAELYQVLLQRCGIRSFLVTGQSYNAETGTLEGHEWNLVRIDGEYYHVDVTWDDQGEILYHAYFGLTDALIQEDHYLNATGYALPECTATAAQYHNVMGGRFETYTVEAVAQHLKNNGMAAFFYIPGDLNAFWAWFGSNFGQIAGQAGLSGSITSSAGTLGHEMYIKLEKVLQVVAQGTCGTNLTWKLDEEGTLTISGTGAMNQYEEYLWAPWYKHRAKITSIVIEEGVTSIGGYAFYECNQVKKVTIPSTIAKVGNYAFYLCSALENVYITDLAAWCDIDFFGNYDNPLQYTKNFCVNDEAVVDLVIPDGVTKVKPYTFGHGGFRSIVFPDGLTEIGHYAFYQCTGLYYVVMPDSLQTIGVGAFGEIASAGIWHVLYAGTEEQWKQIDRNNNHVATVHYEANGDEVVDAEAFICKLCCEHNWVFVEETLAPNCTHSGENKYVCTLCGGEELREVPALGHSGEVLETVAPTCTETGYTRYHCTVCGEEWNADVVDALGHSWTEATCVDPKTCTVCGATDGEALGHNWMDATCIDPKTCTVCGATDGEALGHDWKDATCVDPKTCAVCGATDGEALGHNWQDATCVDPKICTVCGETDGDALGHAYSAVTVPPTIEEDGYTEYTCTVCGHTYRDNYVSFATRGDLDGDGERNTDDAIYLLYNVMFGDEDYPISQSGDLNGDGEKNTDDAIYLLYCVMFGEEDYPLA